jgi:hypothetical protein
VSLEAMVALLGFIAFIGVLVHAQAEALKKMHKVELADDSEKIRAAFGKTRCPTANFTRWFR